MKTAEQKKKYLADYYARNKAKHAENGRIWREKNREKQRIYWANYRKNNRLSLLEKKRRYAAENAEKIRVAKRNWYLKNKERIGKRQLELQRERRKRKKIYRRPRGYGNPYRREKTAFYRIKRYTGVPKWVNRKELLDFYSKCPLGYAVDHIVPIRHKMVCGLHVPWNLQYLPESENAAKGNHYFSSDFRYFWLPPAPASSTA